MAWVDLSSQTSDGVVLYNLYDTKHCLSSKAVLELNKAVSAFWSFRGGPWWPDILRVN